MLIAPRRPHRRRAYEQLVGSSAAPCRDRIVTWKWRVWSGGVLVIETKGVRPGDCRAKRGGAHQEIGEYPRIPWSTVKESHTPLVGSSNLPLATSYLVRARSPWSPNVLWSEKVPLVTMTWGFSDGDTDAEPPKASG